MKRQPAGGDCGQPGQKGREGADPGGPGLSRTQLAVLEKSPRSGGQRQQDVHKLPPLTSTDGSDGIVWAA